MKKHYSDYPPSFLSILDHFSSSDEPLERRLPYHQAASTRHQFYRFAQAVYRADETGDRYATQLASVARRVSISLSPSHAAPDEPTTMSIYVNPFEVGLHHAPTGEHDDTPEIDPDEVERIIAERRKS